MPRKCFLDEFFSFLRQDFFLATRRYFLLQEKKIRQEKYSSGKKHIFFVSISTMPSETHAWISQWIVKSVNVRSD